MGWGGGWGGGKAVWGSKTILKLFLMKNISSTYMFINSRGGGRPVYSLWRGKTMCTVVSQFMVSKLILNFFQFVENPWTQNKMMCAAPTRELFSRRTLVRRIQQKLCPASPESRRPKCGCVSSPAPTQLALLSPICFTDLKGRELATRRNPR